MVGHGDLLLIASLLSHLPKRPARWALRAVSIMLGNDLDLLGWTL